MRYGLFTGACLCVLASCAVATASSPVPLYVDGFETLSGIHCGGGARAELSTDVAHEGAHSLKVLATVNPQDALVFVQDKAPIDLSTCNALSLWVYPDVLDGTFAVDVRSCVWDEKKKRGRWFTIGNLSEFNTPNRRWTRHCFYLGRIPRRKVLRVLDMVAWHHAAAYRKGERFTLYIDDLRIFAAPFSRDGILLNGGFEGELLPWRRPGRVAASQVTLNTKVRVQGKSSVRLHATRGMVSPTLVQGAKATGGAWFEVSGWVRVEKASNARLTLNWSRMDAKPIMRTYRRSAAQVVDASGSGDFKQFRRIVCAPEMAERCMVALSVEKGVAWFDGLAIRPVADGADKFSWLSMPPKETVFWRERGELPLRRETKSLASVRVAFVPSQGQTLAVALAGENGPVPLLRIRGGVVTVCDGGTWRELPWLLGAGRPIVICASARRAAFGVNSCGVVLPWRAPFEIRKRMNEIRGVSFEGKGTLSRVLVEGPLWELTDFVAVHGKHKRMSLTMRKGIGWLVPENELPDDLRGKAVPPSPWREKAVILHTALPFRVLSANIEQILSMGFNTLCLRPVHPTGRIGFGSSCCIQDYTAISPAKGTAEELRALVKRAHELQMRVIFWLVPNHASASNQVFQSRPALLFTDAGIPRSAWFDVVDFDYANPETWRFMANVGKFWIREFDLDGFGLDVPDLLPRNFVRYFKQQLLTVKKSDIFILGESSGAHLEQWGMDCRYGFLSAFQMREILEGVTPPPKPPQRVIARLVQRLYPHETLEAFGPFGANIGFVRFLKRYGEGATKCATALMATLPLVPEVFVGSELLEPHVPHSAMEFMVKTLRLRAQHPALRSYDVTMLEHDHPELACAYLKCAPEELALVVINFRDRETRLRLKLDADSAARLQSARMTDLLTGRPVKLRWADNGKLLMETAPLQIALYAARPGP